jgi:hypothetical protein
MHVDPTFGTTWPDHSPIDITYASLAKAFDTPLEYHAETLHRMEVQGRRPTHPRTPEQTAAFKRMALFPKRAEALHVAGDAWVVSSAGSLHSISSLSRVQPFSLLCGSRVACACYLAYRDFSLASSKDWSHFSHSHLLTSARSVFL